MLKHIFVLIAFVLLLVSCPKTPINPDPIPDPTPEPIVIKQECKIEWGNGRSFEDYDAMLAEIEFYLSTSDCTANTLLCIEVYDETECERIWKFETMDEIPRHTFTDECGNVIIHYLSDDL